MGHVQRGFWHFANLNKSKWARLATPPSLQPSILPREDVRAAARATPPRGVAREWYPEGVQVRPPAAADRYLRNMYSDGGTEEL